MRSSATFLFCLVAACAVNSPASGPTVETVADPDYLRITIDSTVRGADRETVESLLATTEAIIRSDAFARNLAGLQDSWLWLSPYGELLSPAGVAQIYQGRNRTVRFVPTTIEVVDQNSPTQGFRSADASVIRLPPYVLDRWRAESLVARSCAVNSLAHEIAHSFSQSRTSAEHVFADRGKGRFPPWFYGPLASYTIGAAAQCTMLEAEERLEGGFARCMRTWGTKQFNSNYCSGAATVS
jgi:hypothetical protein